MGTATLIRKTYPMNPGVMEQAVYRLDPPMTAHDYFANTDPCSRCGHVEEESRSVSVVLVSAADVMYSGPETYIFEAAEDGEVINWSELHGSLKGGLDHAEALRGAGYEIA